MSTMSPKQWDWTDMWLGVLLFYINLILIWLLIQGEPDVIDAVRYWIIEWSGVPK